MGFSFRLPLLFGVALFLSACQAPRSVVAQGKPERTEDTVLHSRDADDFARFIAGIPGSPDSPFKQLEKDPAWEDHQRQLDKAWHSTDKELLSGYREFQTRELLSPGFANRTVFYPFSGPDVLTATLFFPHTPTYVMVGLEPAGTLPTLKQIQKKNLATYLGAVRQTMSSELGRSFFVTRDMDREFRGQVTDGLLLPILQLLVRTGEHVLGIRYIRIDEEGHVIDRDFRIPVEARFANKGVEIEFQTEADSSLHKLYYFSVNISDERVRENTGFRTYLSTLTSTTSMLKATSYMIHRPNFSVIRDALLANSDAILQDDSGIPYHWYTPETWKVQLYGDYTRPYGSFRWLEQADLRKAYQTTGPKPLPMRIGYGYHRIASNLLLAERVKSLASNQ